MTLDEFDALLRSTAHYDVELPIEDFDFVVEKLGCRLHEDRGGRTYFNIWTGTVGPRRVYCRAVSLG